MCPAIGSDGKKLAWQESSQKKRYCTYDVGGRVSPFL